LPAKRNNPRLIKLHLSYTVEDVSARLGVHKNTVRSWQRKGLEPIDKFRPVMFTGKTLRAYLEGKRKAAKRPCPPGTFYCFKCRTAQSPALGMVDYIPRNALSGNLSALCGACGTVMNRRAAFASLALKKPGIDVQIKGAP
jgi:Helix-turn-helix domain